MKLRSLFNRAAVMEEQMKLTLTGRQGRKRTFGY
jgi:hypothetical protein